MKILLLTTADQGGGAAEATLRLFYALERSPEVEVRLLVLHRETNHPHIASLKTSRIKTLQARAYFLLERLEIFARNRLDRQQLFRLSTAHWGFDVATHPWVSWAETIHLHWINQGMLSLSGFRRLVGLGKPIVWTLHDLWAGAGGCHLPIRFDAGGAEVCASYTSGCGSCPLLNSHSEADWSRSLCREKAFLASERIHYIAVSRASALLFAQAYNMRDRSSLPSVIPPPIHPAYLSERASDPASLPFAPDPSTHYLLLAAARLDDDVKGGKLLIELSEHLNRLRGELSITLLLVGAVREEGFFDRLALPVDLLGSIQSKETMRELYQLSSVTLSTSLFETFGQTLSESISCGCPIVSFRCGGPEDIVLEGMNGYLAPAYDTEAMAGLILQILRQPLPSTQIKKTSEPYTPEAITQAHLQLYRSLD